MTGNMDKIEAKVAGKFGWAEAESAAEFILRHGYTRTLYPEYFIKDKFYLNRPPFLYIGFCMLCCMGYITMGTITGTFKVTNKFIDKVGDLDFEIESLP